MRTNLIFVFLLFTTCKISLSQQVITVDVHKKGAEVQPEMYGVFFEDINFGADGGLYAEMIKNRSFEFEHPFVGWVPFGDVNIEQETPCFEKNPHYARLVGRNLRTLTGMENEGFKGMGIKRSAVYKCSFYARVHKGDSLQFRIELVSSGNDIVAQNDIKVAGSDWKKYQCTLTSKATDKKAKFRIKLISEGSVDMDHISLFPKDTWKGRENGLRQDLVQALYDLNPGVFRFPGGCIVEGNTLETRYQWKNSVGPVENRPTNINRWNYTFKHKFFPDYYQSYGLGFYEYFLLSEDIGAEPLPVLNVGLSCQYEGDECVALNKLDPYIQDAVDLVEFANGSKDTKWGKLRADMGHPESFNLKKIAIGNEQWGEVYVERLQMFVKVMREKCPEIEIVGSSGPAPDGDKFDYLWPKMRELKVDLVDEHYYRSPEWFLENADRYDTYDRKGPKVFAGEYAAHPKNRHNNFQAAIAEAAFMTGLERNADMVQMATYAPLFAHVDAWQWRPDMIWFDNLSSVRTPNYYVQQMYGQNAGTHVLPATVDGQPLTGKNGLYASSVFDAHTSEVVVKVVNVNLEGKALTINLSGMKKQKIQGEAYITAIQSDDLEVINTLEAPSNIVPQRYSLKADGHAMEIDLEGNSFYVIRIPVR